MLEKLRGQFSNTSLRTELPTHSNGMYWFSDQNKNQYLGIPKTEITNDQLEILQTLFPLKKLKHFHAISGKADEWHEILYHHQGFPPSDEFRIIQFHLTSESIDIDGLREAFESIFSLNAAIGMISDHSGFIVEENHEFTITEEDFSSAVNAFESDFYTKSLFYFGTYRKRTDFEYGLFEQEQRLFHYARKYMLKDKFATFEKVFPLILLSELAGQERFSRHLLEPILQLFKTDHDLFLTVKKYIENHNNTSLTAKQLYMHRNSLQYRIDKFIDMTGIDLKSFSGTMTVYLACMEFDYFRNHHHA